MAKYRLRPATPVALGFAFILALLLPGSGSSGLSREKPQEILLSPRLAALAEKVAGGDHTALEHFWREVAEQGAPLIEPVENDKKFLWVTFLYRGRPDLNNVVLFIDRGLWGDIASNSLARLDSTDVWYRTYRFRKDARFTYSLSANDPLTPLREIKDPRDWAKRASIWQADPLNPRQFPSFPRPVSILELPGALPQPYIAPRPGVPRGAVQTHKLKSHILGNERTIWVYTPSGHEPKNPPRGLLILFDGGLFTSQVPTPTILDNLLSEGRLPPLAAVFIGHPDLPTRNRELTCSEPFTRFLVEEMLPWLCQTYSLNPDPALTIVAGTSNGGLAAAFAAFRHPDIFGSALSMSGAFVYSPPAEKEPEWLIRQFAASTRLPIRFHLDAGLMEDQSADASLPSLLVANRHLRDVLRSKGYELHYQEFNGGHEFVNWRGTLADGLIALLGGQASK